jgi:hypothetical protein
VSCDFGPKEQGVIHGYPSVFDYVKVGSKRTNTNGSIYVDLNGNGWMDGQEHLTGVSGLGLVGALTLLVGGASVFLARRRTA